MVGFTRDRFHVRYCNAKLFSNEKLSWRRLFQNADDIMAPVKARQVRAPDERNNDSRCSEASSTRWQNCLLFINESFPLIHWFVFYHCFEFLPWKLNLIMAMRWVSSQEKQYTKNSSTILKVLFKMLIKSQ